MQVEVSTEKISGRNLTNLSVEEIQGIMDGAAEKATVEVNEEDTTLTLAAIGAGYQVGPIDINIALGNLVLLQEIDSPFINGKVGSEGDELKTGDCMKALYVLGKGKEAIRPIMAIKQRIQNMMQLKPMVESNSDLFQQLMDRIEKISESEKDFEEAARKYYADNFVGHDFQEVMDSVFASLSDIMKISGDLPQQDGKKKA